MSGFVLVRMPVSTSMPAAEWADFEAATALMNRIQADVLGSDDFAQSAVERLPYATDPAWSHAEVVAKVDDEVVGYGMFEGQLSATEGWIEIFVAPEHRRAGVGTAILHWLIDAARAESRTELNAHLLARADAPGTALTPASGHGSVWSGDDGIAFGLASGFTLEQADQVNRLALPVPTGLLDERTAIARDGHGDDYELVRWVGRVPEEWLTDMAALNTEMSTADPHADLQVTEDVWDADRIREADDREADSPRTKLTAASLDRASGRLVGFSMLDVPAELDRPVHQWTTIVSATHRGHRLGLAVKLENIRQLQDTFPGHPCITTMNAEENAYMIGVNRSVGFELVGRGATLRRRLGD